MRLLRTWWWSVALLVCSACAPAPTVVQPCAASDVRLSARAQGGGGALAGGLQLARTSSSTSCTLPGQLQVSLVNGQGVPLPVDEQPAPLCTGTCAPQDTVTIGPGESAGARFTWQNWCPQSPIDAVTIQLSQPAVSVPLDGTPRCDVADAPSTLGVGPTEKLRQ